MELFAWLTLVYMFCISEVTFVPVSKVNGQAEVEDVLAAVRPTTCLVTIMLANNETGVIMVRQPSTFQGAPGKKGLGMAVSMGLHSACSVSVLELCGFALPSAAHAIPPHHIRTTQSLSCLPLPISACPRDQSAC